MKNATLIITLAMSTAAINMADAQTAQQAANFTVAANQRATQQNPWALLYDGAIAKNEKGKVHLQPVTYKLNGIDIAANVYTPADYDAAKKYPAVVEHILTVV